MERPVEHVDVIYEQVSAKLFGRRNVIRQQTANDGKGGVEALPIMRQVQVHADMIASPVEALDRIRWLLL